MGAYFLRRAVIGIVVLFGITFLCFGLLSLAPGDPIQSRLDPEVLARLQANPELLQAKRRELGLDQPFYIQYARWLAGAARGDLGFSLSTKRPITEEIARRVVPTLTLMGSSILIAILVGIPFGMLAAVHQYGKLDYLLNGITIFLVSTPTFVIGLIGLYVFGVSLRILPVGDMFSAGKENDLGDRFAHLLMPAVILGLANAAPLMRYTRASMLDVINSDYMTTARAKGLVGRVVVIRHGLRNALIPIITLIGVLLPELIAGAVITEQVFNWQGMGLLSVRAAGDRDPPLVVGIVLLIGVAVVVSSILADLAYGIVDPRVRYVRDR